MRKRIRITSPTVKRRHLRQLAKRTTLTAHEKKIVKHVAWTHSRNHGGIATRSGRIMIVEFPGKQQVVVPAECTLAVWDDDRKEYFHSVEPTIPFVEVE